MDRDLEFVRLALGGPGRDAVSSDAAPAMSLQALARLAGGYQWVERRLFEVLGAWVESEPSAEAKLLYDVYSQQHAWHADLFAERLPVSGVLVADSSDAPPAGVVRMFEVLARGGAETGVAAWSEAGGHGSGPTALRLVGLSRVVLPRLVVGFTRHLQRAQAVSDAPVIRAIRLTVRDELEEWQVLEALVQSLARRPEHVEVVSAWQRRLEGLVADGGPGLVPWPEPESPGDAPRLVDEGTAGVDSVSADGVGSAGPDGASAQFTAMGAPSTGERRS